jgi:Uma2 family endonuclease
MVEIIKGKVMKMSPAPNTFHQTISINLVGLFRNQLKGQPCKLFHAPTDVRLITKGRKDEDIQTVVQPDVFVVCDPSKLDERGCLGSPDLIIEILSPATAEKDLTYKFDLYQEAGVTEYWIVFPNDQIVETFLLENGLYKKSGVYAEEKSIPVRVLPGLEVAVRDVFER